MRILSALMSLFGLGSKSFEPLDLEQRVELKAPYIDPETHVFHGGRHSKGSRGMECPACYTNTSKHGLCMNRMCPRFNAKEAHTHPDLLCLDRPTRLEAQARWARGGMAALFAR